MRLFFITILIGITLLAGSVFSQPSYYVWTDGDGNVKFASDPSEIPEKYRSRAVPGPSRRPTYPKSEQPSSNEQENTLKKRLEKQPQERSEQQQTEAPQSSPPENIRYTNPGYIACLFREDLDRVATFMSQKDNTAIARMIMDGQCIILKPDIEVYIDESKFWSGMIKIRPRGFTVGMWTFREAIRR